MVIRLAQDKDFDRLFELEKECFATRFRWTKPTFRRAFEYDLKIWVAESWSKEVFGFVATEDQDKWGYISTLDVDPCYQGHGIGAKLMDHAEKHFKDGGMEKMRLHVYYKNTAMALYTKRGYVPLDMKKNYYANGEHAVYMEKTL